MNILRDSQLVIFSPSTIFTTFSYKSFSSNSRKVRGGENRKWHWMFAFDCCVIQTRLTIAGVCHLVKHDLKNYRRLISAYDKNGLNVYSEVDKLRQIFGANLKV